MSSKLRCIKLLGEGSYGAVWKVESSEKLQFAVKALKKHMTTHYVEEEVDILRDIAKEYKIMLRFSASPFVVRVLGMASASTQSQVQSAAMVMELCHSNLFQELQGEVGFNQRRVWASHVAGGLVCLHDQGVCWHPIHIFSGQISGFVMSSEIAERYSYNISALLPSLSFPGSSL